MVAKKLQLKTTNIFEEMRSRFQQQSNLNWTEICTLTNNHFLQIRKQNAADKKLANHIRNRGHLAIESESDADFIIVKTALQYAKQGKEVILIAEDCDILVLCIQHSDNKIMKNINICKFSKFKNRELYSVRDLTENLNPVIRQHILFGHGYAGCDTTSQFFIRENYHF